MHTLELPFIWMGNILLKCLLCKDDVCVDRNIKLLYPVLCILLNREGNLIILVQLKNTKRKVLYFLIQWHKLSHENKKTKICLKKHFSLQQNVHASLKNTFCHSFAMDLGKFFWGQFCNLLVWKLIFTFRPANCLSVEYSKLVAYGSPVAESVSFLLTLSLLQGGTQKTLTAAHLNNSYSTSRNHRLFVYEHQTEFTW